MSRHVFIEEAGLSGGNARPRRDSLGLRGAAVMVEPAGLSGLGSTGATVAAGAAVGVLGLALPVASTVASIWGGSVLWKDKHKVLGGILVAMGGLSAVMLGAGLLAASASNLSGLYRSGSGKGGTPDDSI